MSAGGSPGQLSGGVDSLRAVWTVHTSPFGPSTLHRLDRPHFTVWTKVSVMGSLDIRPSPSALVDSRTTARSGDDGVACHAPSRSSRARADKPGRRLPPSPSVSKFAVGQRAPGRGVACLSPLPVQTRPGDTGMQNPACHRLQSHTKTGRQQHRSSYTGPQLVGATATIGDRPSAAKTRSGIRRRARWPPTLHGR